MSAQPEDHKMEGTEATGAATVGKGKGKAPQAPDAMEEDDDSSSEESAPEDQTVEEVEDEDNMEEIDPSNIITTGRRTRGKNIDFSKAAQDVPEDEDEEDDEDFKAPEDDDDAMQE